MIKTSNAIESRKSTMLGFVKRIPRIVVWIMLVYMFTILFGNTAVIAGKEADIVASMNKRSYMPKYCQCRLTEADLRKKIGGKWPIQFQKMRDKYVKIFGKSYTYLHHYCFGLKYLHNASQIDFISHKKDWTRALQLAIGEFQFVENSMGYPSFPLKAQLHRYKAQAHNMLGEYQKAHRENAIAAKYLKKRK